MGDLEETLETVRFLLGIGRAEETARAQALLDAGTDFRGASYDDDAVLPEGVDGSVLVRAGEDG